MSPIGNRPRDFLRLPGARAFTLIELALVAFVLLVLIGISAPALKRSFSNLILKDSSFSISKLINYAQEKAIIDRKNFKIELDFEGRRYWLSEIDNLQSPPAYKKASGRLGTVFTLPRALSFEGPKKEIIFYPDGRSDEVYIDILASAGDGYRITVKGFGRTVDIKEINNER